MTAETAGHVIERIGRRLEADGLPRVASRVLGYLVVAPGAESLDEIGDALGVSKASVSTSCRLLERLGVVERVTHAGDRRDYYRVAEDLPVRVLEARTRQLAALQGELSEAAESPAIEAGEVRRRLRRFADFFGHMLEVVEEARSEWCEGGRTGSSRGGGR